MTHKVILIILNKIAKSQGVEKIDYQQSFNRNLFFIYFPEDIIKTEFTYYPFSQIEEGKRFGELKVDSLVDIATNKIFTIYQKPNARHFIDLYLILRQENWSIDDLIRKAKRKFDWHVDPILLGTQFTQVLEVKDYPRMIIKLDEKDWREFFVEEAKRLSNKILK